MKKTLNLFILLVAGAFYFSGAMASEEGSDSQKMESPDNEEIVAICEDKYSQDNYSDDTERGNLIDICIGENGGSGGAIPAAEEG